MPDYNLFMGDNLPYNFINKRNSDFDKKLAEKLNEKTDEQMSKLYKYKFKEFHSYDYESTAKFNNAIAKFINDKELIDIKYSTCYKDYNSPQLISSVLIIYN